MVRLETKVLYNSRGRKRGFVSLGLQLPRPRCILRRCALDSLQLGPQWKSKLLILRAVCKRTKEQRTCATSWRTSLIQLTELETWIFLGRSSSPDAVASLGAAHLRLPESWGTSLLKSAVAAALLNDCIRGLHPQSPAVASLIDYNLNGET